MSASTGYAKSMAVLVKKESDESLDDLEDTRRTIESAESRARLGRKKSEHKIPLRSDREFAEALHREADQLYQSGDYESALVLYHRAASVYPRDSSHGVAARRTSATISSWNNPTKAQRKLLPNAGDQARLAASGCPELAAVKASNALKISPTPAAVSEVLSYFDNHKQFWQSLPSPRGKNDRLTQSRAMLKQLNSLASLSLKNLEAAFASGKITTAQKTAQELLTLSSGLPEPRHYQIAAYHYLSLIHVSLGRHDRASSSVSQMVRHSKSLGNPVLFCRSLVTLGKVHLSFGHLEAAARAWQHLAQDVNEPIPLAWLQHEIGRCYLETGRNSRAMEMAIKCTKTASDAGSKKWLLFGNLLLGQALAKLGRFAEALEQLKVVTRITKDEGDTPMLSYVQDLMEQVTQSLRKIAFDRSGRWRPSQTNILDNSAHLVSRWEESLAELVTSVCAGKGDALMTTVFSRTQRLTEVHNGTSSSEEFLDAGGEITTELSTETKSTGQPLYQGSRTRSEERISEGLDDLLPGNTTFRIRSPSQSSSCSSESIHAIDSARTKVLAVESSEFGSAATSLDEHQEDSNLPGSSAGSLKSVGTNHTYIVKHDDDKHVDAWTKEDEENTRKLEFNETMSEDVKALLEKYNLPRGVLGRPIDYSSSLNAIQELDKKDEQELLEILKNLLLDEENSELPEVFRNDAAAVGVSKDSERGSKRTRTRSCEDAYHKVLGNRTLFRHSLPPSPRDCEVETVSHTCDTYRKHPLNTV